MACIPVPSPGDYLAQRLGMLPVESEQRDLAPWWERVDKEISAAAERGGRPDLWMFTRFARRCDAILPRRDDQIASRNRPGRRPGRRP